MSQKVYNCFFSDCGLQFTVLYEWTSHMRKHAANRYLSLNLRSPMLYLPAEQQISNVMPSAGSGSGSGAGARGGGVRAVQRATVTSPRTGTGSTLRTVAGGTVSKPSTSSTTTTSSHDLTRDGNLGYDYPRPSSWPQDLSTTSAISSGRPSTTAPIFFTTPKGTATPLNNSNVKNSSTQEKLPSTSSSSTLPANAPITASLEGLSSLPVRNSTRLGSLLSPTSRKITKVTLSYKEPSAAPSSTSPTASLPAAQTPLATSSLQSGPQRERNSIPSSKRARSPSPSLSASSSSTSAKRRNIEEPEDYIDIDGDDDQDSTTSSTTARSSSRQGAHPCEWVKRRKTFIKPFILEAAPCQLGFDTEAELFSHYAWHIDQLEIDDECPVTTCRMKILSDEHLKTHYQKMHPDLPVPAREPTSLNTTTSSKYTGRPAALTAATARAGRASHSPSELPVNPARTRTITPTPPPQQNATPTPPTPTKSRNQSKLQQTRILSERDKAKTTTNKTTPPITAANNNATANQSHNKTKARLTTTTHLNDDEDDDNTRPMAFGFFFKKRS